MKLRRITIDVPIDLRLASLEEISGGWVVALQVPSTWYLQARRAASPQAAVDATVRAIRENSSSNHEPVPSVPNSTALNDLEL